MAVKHIEHIILKSYVQLYRTNAANKTEKKVMNAISEYEA